MKPLKNLVSNALSRLYLMVIYGSDLRDRDWRVRYEAVKAVGDLAVAGKCNPHAFNLLIKVYENRDEEPRTRGDALDAIWRTNPQWLPAVPGLDILEETVNQLITLFDQHSEGTAFTDLHIGSEPVRAIGVRLDTQGGLDLMLLAWVRFQLQRPTDRHTLIRLWCGIGSWPKGWALW
jgi:hypothetical protein